MISVLRFSNVPVYEPAPAEYHRTGGPMVDARRGIRTRPWRFTPAYTKIMEAFGQAARAGLRSDVRMDINLDGVTALWGEIEVERHG